MSHDLPELLSEQRSAPWEGEQLERITEFVRVSREILGEENIQTIILFGSKSTGTDDVWSDFDFYVVTRDEFRWNEKFEINKRLEFPIDIIFRTYSEMEDGIRLFSSIDIYAIYFGQIVYGEELNIVRERAVNALEKGEIILRPELGKGVTEYGSA